MLQITAGLHGDAIVLCLAGTLRRSTSAPLLQKIHDITRIFKAPFVLLDLAELTASPGAADVLTAVRDHVTTAGGQVALAAAPPELTAKLGSYPSYRTLEDAISASS